KENAQLKDKIAALEKELAPYKNLVNGQTYLFENGKFTAVEVTKATPLSIYFDLGSSKISAREKAHLEYFCENAVDADTKLAINGYADKQTGSARTNQKLSENRVKAVVDLLKKAGAQESNMDCSAHGDTINPFDGAAKNRVVTIEVK
ncbi:MAG: OmpA family protein, partial [Bacteroidales bacterium]|nr:OmpA family protein [Bacteroidales bacterium]